MPEVAAKTPGAYIRKIDGACIDRHVCYPSLACAAILAALFDSEERALTLLGEQHKETHSQANIDGAENRAIESFLRGDDIKTACKAHGVTLAAFGTRLRERHSAISV